MKRSWFAACLAFLIAVPATASAQVQWSSDDLAAALTRARSTSRPVLVEMSAEWCIPCQRMEAGVWNTRAVSTAVNNNYVAIKLDWDTDAGQRLRERLDIKALPVVIALRADGTEVDRLEGEAEAGFVVSALDAWRTGRTTLSALETWLSTHPNDVLRHMDAGQRYIRARNTAQARTHLERVVALDTNNTRGLAAQALFALGDTLSLRTMNTPNNAIAPLQTLVQRYGTSTWGLKAHLSLATALHRSARDRDAVTVFDNYVRAGGADAMTIASRAANVLSLRVQETWDLAEAERFGRAALVRAPRNPALLDALGQVLFARRQFRDAVQMAQSAVRYEPSNRDYRRRLDEYRRVAPAS